MLPRKGGTKDGAHKLSPSTSRAVQQEKMPVLSAKQIKEKKAASRKRKHADSTPLAQSNVKEPCFLERQAVTPSREQSYARAWAGFLQFVKTHRLKINTVTDLDAAVAWAVNEQFFEGDSLATPQTLLAAVKYHRQDVAKVAVLTRASQALRGFRRLAPSQARTPLPYPMLAFMMIQTVLAGEYWVAFWMALTWAVSCRPGETLKLAVKHIVSPNKLCRYYSLLLSPSGPMDLCLPSKTGDMDENLLIDQPYLQWVGQILGRMKRRMQGDQPLFLFDVVHAGQVFKNIAAAAGYQPLGVVHSYQIRHGAASTDALTGLRTMEEIAKRGRWRCLSSVRRYEQGGKLAQIFGQLSEVQQNEALRAEKQVGHVMTSRFSEFFPPGRSLS